MLFLRTAVTILIRYRIVRFLLTYGSYTSGYNFLTVYWYLNRNIFFVFRFLIRNITKINRFYLL